jgi:hypothetical protein
MSDLAVQLDATESDRMRTASEEPAQVADNSAASRTEWNSRLVRWIIIFGIVLVGAIIASTGVVLLDLRDRELAESERELKRLVFVLAEQIDRSFQSMVLIQTAVIERMQSLGIASAEDYERQMSAKEYLRVSVGNSFSLHATNDGCKATSPVWVHYLTKGHTHEIANRQALYSHRRT